MSISFSQLSYDLQKQIAQKMDYAEYINFEKASSITKTIAEAVTTRVIIRSKEDDSKFPQVVMRKDPRDETSLVIIKRETTCADFVELNFTFVAKNVNIYIMLTEDFCQELIDFFNATSSKTKRIDFNVHFSGVECSAETFNLLLEKSGAEEFDYRKSANPLPEIYFRTNAMKKMKFIYAYTRPLNDEDILALQAEKIELRNANNFSSEGINLFLAQYIRGVRSIKNVHICLNDVPDRAIVFRGIEHECSFELPLKKDLEISIRGRKLFIWLRETYIEFNESFSLTSLTLDS